MGKRLRSMVTGAFVAAVPLAATLALGSCSDVGPGPPPPTAERFELVSLHGKPAPTKWDSADDLTAYTCYFAHIPAGAFMLLSQSLDFPAAHDSVVITTVYSTTMCLNGYSPGGRTPIDTNRAVERRAVTADGNTFVFGPYGSGDPGVTPAPGNFLVRTGDKMAMGLNPDLQFEFQYRKVP